jgi:magnesium transporter
VSLDRVKAAVNRTTTSQVAQVLGELEPKEQAVAFRLLEKNRAILVFEMLDPGEQTGLVRAMEDPELVRLLEELSPEARETVP